jgi:class 3 adenylate cyclase
MQQIADWLEKLGLSEYADRFAQNDIDVSVLRHLTDQDLKELGISLGHRRKLLAAVAEMTGTGTAAPTMATEPKLPDTAERRQVTVMFSDLVGSTALSARIDAEDLREVISAYQKCVTETVRRFGGFVANYMGDGVLVYFGYPEAHEDDAERAVRAGLELIAAVSALKTSASLQTRVGIATGLVVVGDLVGSGSAQEHAIVGETPNLAARLQGAAEPNTVIIAEGTRKLLGTLFELEDLRPKDLKGIAKPVRAWAVLRTSSVESRFEALHASGLTALVGREEESELLMRRWSRAKSGEGQVVLLSGEAGIGKSRLTAALLESIALEPHTCLRYFCSPQHTDSAFYPIIGQMARAAGLAHGDTSKMKLDKLDALLAQTSTSVEHAALFAELLSLPNDDRYPALDTLTAEQRRQRTLQVLVSRMEALARQHPVLMILEDAHWADPTSLEAFSRCVDRIASLRVLLIATFRPEFEPPWIGRPHVTALTLNRLAQREVGAIIDRVVGNKPLPAGMRQDIIERSDGIPLFIEEMTKATLEAESQGAAEETVASTPSPTRAVPASLHASLMSRLDRLGAAKEVAQIGAALGREFSHALLSAVLRKPDAELGSALGRLIASGLLFRQGVPPHATYLFKHSLVQDAAYGTLLREPRRALHARIADTLESQFAEIAEGQPELLARHCTEAGLNEKAAGLWRKAGQWSLERSALAEAVQQLTCGLEQITVTPSTSALRREQIKLQVTLLNALTPIKGWGAPETKAAAERARLLIEQAEARGEPPDDPMLLFSVLHSLWVGSLGVGVDAHLNLAGQSLALAEKQGTTAPLMLGHRQLGLSLAVAGNLVQAVAHFDQALALYDPAEHRPLVTRFGADSRVIILGIRSETAWMLGQPDVAAVDAEHGLQDAREVNHAPTLMLALRDTSSTHALRGSYATASPQADELVTLADEKGALPWKVTGMLIQGRLAALTGKARDAVPMLTSGIAALRSMGQTLIVPTSLSHLAMAHAEVGQFDDAWRCICEAIMTAEASKVEWWEAEFHRMAGEIARSPPSDAAKAESYFERSLSVARAQQAKSWELRTAMSMARLWRNQDKPQQARDLLAPIYAWFTEGFDTRDLKEAKTLLDALSS